MKPETVKANQLTITPVNLLEVVEVIGEADALKIVERFGGTTQRLPALRNITPDHLMAMCIGVEQLTVLVKIIGGGRWLYVARCARGLREQRNRDIVALYSPPHNMSVMDLARRYHMSDRHVWRILGSTVVDDRQVSLF